MFSSKCNVFADIKWCSIWCSGVACCRLKGCLFFQNVEKLDRQIYIGSRGPNRLTTFTCRWLALLAGWLADGWPTWFLGGMGWHTCSGAKHSPAFSYCSGQNFALLNNARTRSFCKLFCAPVATVCHALSQLVAVWQASWNERFIMNSNAIPSTHSLSSPVPNILKDVVSPFFLCGDGQWKSAQLLLRLQCSCPKKGECFAPHLPFCFWKGECHKLKLADDFENQYQKVVQSALLYFEQQVAPSEWFWMRCQI